MLTLPLAAVRSQNGRSFVLMRAAAPDSVRRMPVRLGLQDESNVEIESGLSASDVVVTRDKAFVLPKNNGGSNPFLPSPPRDKKRSQ